MPPGQPLYTAISAPQHALGRIFLFKDRIEVALTDEPVIAFFLRGVPARGLPLAGDRGLQRHLGVLISQPYDRLGKIEVAAVGHPADKVPHAAVPDGLDRVKELLLQPFAARVGLV